MAKAYECDVCGDLFKRKGASDAAVVVYYRGYGEERKDLCPKCQKEFESWLKGKEGKIK